jgi:NAD(P)-dependent dehydrogenase (short-subunit alcohol dehydrogenase family)
VLLYALKLNPAIRSSGLGLATVLEIHRRGGYSAVLDIQNIPEKAKLALGSKARYFKCDLTKSGEIEQAVNQAVSWSKETNAKLGGVINSGGVAVAAKASDPEDTGLCQLTFWQTITGRGVSHSLDMFEFAMHINVIGTFDLTRRTLEHLIQKEKMANVES